MAVEQWKNQTQSTAFVLKFDRYQNLISELVSPGKTVTVTKEEREINQDRAALDNLDVFKNGILLPVKLVDPEDEREFAENPNLMSEDDLRNLLKLSKPAFVKRINEISNIYPLLRLDELAKEDDTKITAGVSQALADRIEEMTPKSPQIKSFADDGPVSEELQRRRDVRG